VADALHDGKAQTQAVGAVAFRIADLMEFLPDARQVIGRYTDAGIGNLDAQPVAGRPAHHPEATPFGIIGLNAE
jgi:hypothetical protein